MEKFGPKYIGQVSLASIRNWILDHRFPEDTTIFLHPTDMEVVLEDYRQLYNKPMPDPYFFLGVLLEEAGDVLVPENRVVALLGDERAGRPIYNSGPPPFQDDGRDVYRCGWCGSIVDESGTVLEGNERNYAIALLRHREDGGTRHVHGECCANRSQ